MDIQAVRIIIGLCWIYAVVAVDFSVDTPTTQQDTLERHDTATNHVMPENYLPTEI